MLSRMSLVKRKHQNGVGLIEAMIALLVVSIGLLGIASLQIAAMSQNVSALNHSQAVWIAYNLSDRIRSNLPEFNNYDGVDTSNSYSQDCMASACTAPQMLTADAADWKAMVASLPAGRGTITLTNATLLVSVMWDDDGAGATGTGCDPSKTTDLTCYSLSVTQ